MRPMDADAIHRAWEAKDGEYSPEYYAYYGSNETSEAIRAVIESADLEAPSVLELGCSSGRHLAFLAANGNRDLAGIDINPEAIGVLRETYPALAEAGTFYVDAIEDRVPAFEAGEFDVVFSVETLQHLPRDDVSVIDAVARITDELLITVERERENIPEDVGQKVTYVNDEFPLYYRDWDSIFEDRGFTQVESRDLGRYMLRAFRPTP